MRTMNIKEIIELLDLRIRDNVSGVFAPESMNTLRAHIRELESRADNAEKAFVAALKTMSEEARKRGEAEGRLEASEMAGVVDGWKARAEAAEAKVERLHDVLADFARQKKTTELETEYEALNAAFEDAYDMFIDRSRAALAAMEVTDE